MYFHLTEHEPHWCMQLKWLDLLTALCQINCQNTGRSGSLAMQMPWLLKDANTITCPLQHQSVYADLTPLLLCPYADLLHCTHCYIFFLQKKSKILVSFATNILKKYSMVSGHFLRRVHTGGTGRCHDGECWPKIQTS